MDQFFTSFVNSTEDYLTNLQYLGAQKPKTLDNLFKLQILLEVFRWMDWQEYSEYDKEQVKKRIDFLILQDPLLENIAITNTYYKNVNSPQTMYTWQRVYDKL